MFQLPRPIIRPAPSNKVFLLLFVHKKKTHPKTLPPTPQAQKNYPPFIFPLLTPFKLVSIRHMENQGPSFGAQIARLQGAFLTQEKCAWIPNAIHALIIACLARIFARLEQILLQWQSEQLPLPQPLQAPSHTAARQDSARAPRRPTSNRRHRAPTTSTTPGNIPEWTPSVPSQARSAPTHPPRWRPPSNSRAPPHQGVPLKNPPLRHRRLASILFRYRTK